MAHALSFASATCVVNCEVEISDSTDETRIAADLGEHEVCAAYSCFNISSMVTISASPEQP